MYRITLSLVVLLALASALSPAVAQEDPPTISRGYSLKVKEGHEADFEAAMKKQMEWYKKNNETWHWHTWQWETGDAFGEYVFRSPGHHWKDMDERSERGSRARAHFMEVVRPHLDSISAGIGQLFPKLSRWPADMNVPAFVTVYEFKLHYGLGEDFAHIVGKITEVINETDWPVNYAWMATVSGGEVPTFYLVVPHENWADMQGPEQPLWAMMEEAIGRADTDTVKAGLRECVREQHSAVLRFRPELSYIPSN